MGCRRYQKALNEAAAGGLAAERTRWLDEHLEKCPACAARLARRREAMAKVDAVLLGAAEVNASREFPARLQERLAEQAATPPRWPLVRVAAIAALAGLALLGIWAAGSGRFYRPRPAPIEAHVSHRPVTSKLKRSAAPAEANASVTVKPQAAKLRGQRRSAGNGLSAADRRIFEVAKIPPERDAVIQLYHLLQSGKISPRLFLTSGPKENGEISIAPLHIKPLEIPPLKAGGGVAAAGDESQDAGDPQGPITAGTRR